MKRIRGFIVALAMISIFCLAFTDGVMASNRDEALEFKQKGVDLLIVSFEGLASHGIGFVRNGLIEYLESSVKVPFVSKNYAYTDDSKAYSLIRDYFEVYGKNLRIMIIGHSFGGGIAVVKLLKRLKAYVDLKRVKGFSIESVITLDPRSWDGDTKFWTSRNEYLYSAPAGLDILNQYNFYQTSLLMRGYKFKNAKNIKLRTMHTKMPKEKKVRTLCKDLILGTELEY
ncbi:MAG: hypothetical protein AB1403_09020 [Candidatus Riflebacteria bacterium]